MKCQDSDCQHFWNSIPFIKKHFSTNSDHIDKQINSIENLAYSKKQYVKHEKNTQQETNQDILSSYFPSLDTNISHQSMNQHQQCSHIFHIQTCPHVNEFDINDCTINNTGQQIVHVQLHIWIMIQFNYLTKIAS